MLNIGEIINLITNGSLTLIALIVIGLLLNQGGFSQGVALHLAYLGKQNGRLLWVIVVIFAALITAIFGNYITILIFLPIVLEMGIILKFAPTGIFAFVMSVGFIADVASLSLPISNMNNIYMTELLQISFWRYILVMIPINLITAIACLGVLWFYFVPYIPVRYKLKDLPQPSTVIKDQIMFNWTGAFLGLLLLGYLTCQILAIPVFLPAGFAVWLLIGIAGRFFHPQKTQVIDFDDVLENLPVKIVIYSILMYILGAALTNIGLGKFFSYNLNKLSDLGLTNISNIVGFGVMLLSSITNNIPGILLSGISIRDAIGIDSITKEVMIYASLIGANIGGKIIPTASIGTLLWMHILQSKGIKIKWAKYIKMSLVLTLPVLLVTLISLTLWLPWLV
ncbi:MAG TPA: ArsB/NhaD family transporter [Allocoleopsis sp.]